MIDCKPYKITEEQKRELNKIALSSEYDKLSMEEYIAILKETKLYKFLVSENIKKVEMPNPWQVLESLIAKNIIKLSGCEVCKDIW